MTHQTTTYNNSSNQSLPLAFANGRKLEVRRLLLFLIMMVMGVGSAWAQSTPSVWNGTNPTENWSAAIATAAGVTGTGTEADPYVIHDATGFVCFWWASNNGKLNSSSQYWKLDADIDLNNTSWPYVNKNGTFKGKFDGQNHTISNMNLVPPTANLNYGMFCAIEGQAADNRAEVKNLTIDNATVAPSAALGKTTSVGIVIGKSNKYADITNVIVTNSTINYANNISDANYMGGIVGQTLTDTKLTNCSVSKLAITADGTTTNAYFGGMIGYIGSQTDVSCCSTSDVTITYNAIANASHISGFIGYAKGTTAAPTNINGCTVTSTKINLTKGTTAACYIGALLGRNENYVCFGADGSDANKNMVDSPVITIDEDITKANGYIGGVIGQIVSSTGNISSIVNMTVVSPVININGSIAYASYIGGTIGNIAGVASNMSKMDGLTVNSPSVTINKVGVKDCYIGAVFGRINNYTDVKNVTVSSPSFTYNYTDSPNFALNIGSFAGGIIGNANQETTVTNVTVNDKAQLTIGKEADIATTNISQVKAGFVGQLSTYVSIEKWTVKGSEILINGNLTTSASYLGGLAGYITTGCKIKGECSVENPKIEIKGNVGIASYIGGAIGDFLGSNGNTSSIKNLTVKSPSITVNNYSAANSLTGGVFGRVSTYTAVDGVKLTGASLSFSNDLGVAQMIGTFAGNIQGNSTQQISVKNVTIDKSDLTFGTDGNSNTVGLKAGVIGQVSSNVLLDTWTVTGNSTITINGNLATTGSNIGSFVGYATSATSAPLEFNKITLANSNINVTGDVGAASYLGGIGGQIVVTNNATSASIDITGATISGTSSVKVEGSISAGSYFGGFTGYILGRSLTGDAITIKNITLKESDITVDGQTTAGSYFGGLAGMATTGCVFDTWKITGDSKLTFNDDVTGASYIAGAIGNLVGTATYPTSATNITIGNSNITTGTSTSNKVAGSKIGLIGQISTGVTVDKWNVTNSSITINGNLATTASQVGGFVGNAASAAGAPLNITNNNITGNATITVTGSITDKASQVGGFVGYVQPADAANNKVTISTAGIAGTSSLTIGGNVAIGSHLGGFAGYITGRSKDDCATTVEHITLNTANISVTGNTTAGSYYGGLAGYIAQGCTIDDWNITTATVTHIGDVTGGSYIAGALGSITAAANYPSTATNFTVGSSNITIGTSTNNKDVASSKIGLIGQASTNVTLDTWELTGNTSVTVNGNLITGTSYIGGFVGYGATAANGPLTIQSITLKGNSSVFVTGSVSDKAAYLGGFAGYAFSNGNAPVDIKTITMSGDNTVNVSGDINVGSYIAGFAGQVRVTDKMSDAPITIDGITMSEGKKTSVSVGGIKGASYVSGFIGNLYSVASGTTYTNDDINVSNVTIGKVAVSTGRIDVGSTYVSGLVGYANVACTLNNLDITTDLSLTIGGNISATSYIGGALGNLTGNAAFPSSATGIDIAKPAITLNGDISGTLYLGGIAGYQTIATISESKVTDADITLNGNTSNNMYIGGAVGWMNPTAVPYSTIEKVTVKDSKIHSSGTHTYANSNKAFAVGGVVGYMEQTSTKPTDVHNCLADGVDINLGGYVPQDGNTSGNLYNQYQNAFVVGGVIGQYKTPQSLPQSLYYSGKIYAPFAAVGPIVGVFQTNIGAAAYAYDDYAGTNASAISASEWEKASMWIFSDYKLGLSPAVTGQSARTKNYTASTSKIDGVDYLDITPQNLKEFNSVGGAIKPSKTILPYTASGINADLGIYPAWNTNETTYPNYYMYYMQGINRGVCIDATDGDLVKELILNGADATISITPSGDRGFVKSFSATPSSSVDEYAWYYDGKKLSSTTNSCSVVLTIKDVVGPTRNVIVMGIKDGKPVSLRIQESDPVVLRVKNASQAKSTYGSKTNPYLLGGTHGADELQLLSYLSTLDANVAWEEDFVSSTHYNRAYYELESDIDLSSVADFTPISFPKSNGTGGTASGYHQNFVFDGVFDGKFHTISGLKEGWYAGGLNTNDQNIGWGLFSAVGNATATVKVGDAAASNAVIKNLIIDGATLTHKTDNTSFYYPNSTNGNNCMVGVLAGIVSANTTVQNIEIRNSSITDAGSSNYSLATKGLYVGGAIGSVQAAFNATGNAATNTDINHVAANVNISLANPTFADDTQSAQVSQFNIGGIVGRYIATTPGQADVQATLPKYTFYSGSINAEKAWISPVLAAVRHKDQQKVDTWANFSKQWEGNNNTAASQLTIENAQYYNFRINGKLITEFYPKEACDRGARPIELHTDAAETSATYNAAKYQGVNYDARFIDSDQTTLYFMNQVHADDIYWIWENGFPHMTDQKPNDSYLTRVANDFTANMVSGSGSSYRWQVSYDGETWTEVDGLTQQTSSILASARRKLVVAIITVGGTEYRTQAELVEAEELHFAPYIRQTGDDASGYVLTIVWNGEEPSGILSSTYQWYHSDKTSTFGGETNSTINLSKTQLDAETDGLVWCAVTIREMGEEVITIFVKNTANVVYVNGNGYTGNSAGTGIDTNDGHSPQTPVKTIDKANSLLDGGPWEKNIIVVMGTLNNDADFRSNGKNPATLTGKWDGTDYEGIIKLKQIDPSGGENALNPIAPGVKGSNCYVQADTKFEYLTFQANSNTDGNNFIELHGNDVWFGKGLVMTNFANLSKNHGNLEAAQNIPELTIILTATNLNEATIQKYTNRTKPQVVTFESGRYGRIMGGRYTNGFFAAGTNTSHTILGSAEHPVWAVVNIDIDKESPNKGTVNRKESPNTGVKTDDYTCDINCIIAGLTDGSMYGDYTINVHGGKIGYIVGGNQGNPVPNISNSFPAFFQPGGKSGNWGQWPNSSYFGRTVINVEQDLNLKDISIANLYAGGLGREANGNSATSIVDMHIYGHTEINMKRGTVTGNVYGGGAGGIIGLNPWDMHVPYATTDADNATNAVMNGVQYGEWGPKKAGSPLANVTLHDSDDNGGYTTKLLNLGESYTTLNISGGSINGSVYGGGCGYVSNMPKEVVMQGVGSVFGTSNVNISGGTILGSVYGGSEGSDKYYGAVNKYTQTINHIAEMNGTVNLKITYDDVNNPPTIGGNIYGAGMGIASEGGQEYLDIARAGNSALSTLYNKDYTTNINITIDLPANHPFTGNIYGGGQMGAVDGNTRIVIKGGTFNGDVFGGGKGEEGHPNKAKVTGNTKVIVDKNWTEPTTPTP